MKTLSFQHGYLEYQQRKTKAAKKQQNKLKTALFAVAYIIDGWLTLDFFRWGSHSSINSPECSFRLQQKVSGAKNPFYNYYKLSISKKNPLFLLRVL